MTPSIVVLTDFFAVTNRALSYAAGLAAPLRAHLLLLNAREDPLLAPAGFPAQHTVASEMRTLYALEKLAADQPVPAEVDITDDSLAEAVREVVQFREPLFVVLGQAGFEGAPAGLVARTAMNLLRGVPCPLLVVPAVGWDQFPPRRLLLAVDGEPFTLGPQPNVVDRLLHATGGTLDVVHVTGAEQTPPLPSTVLATISENNLAEDTTQPLHLHERRHRRAASGVLAEAAHLEADLLVVVARRHSFWGHLFHESVTVQLLQESPIPVLVLPAAD